MLKFLKDLFRKKPLSLEVQYLIEAIDKDEVRTVERWVSSDAIDYHGKKVRAYLPATGWFSCAVDIDDLTDCLPARESKAVYWALVRYTKRRKQRENAAFKELQESLAMKKLGDL